MEFLWKFTKLKPYLQPWFNILGALKAASLKQHFWVWLFLHFKDISFTVVSFFMMQEVSYTDFIFAFQIWKLYSGTICYDERSLLYWSYSKPNIRRAELLCSLGYTESFRFFNSCKPLQNIVNVEALYAFMVLYVGCSKEPSHWDSTFLYPQHMFWLKTFECIFPFLKLFLSIVTALINSREGQHNFQKKLPWN